MNIRGFKMFLAKKITSVYPPSSCVAVCGSVGKTLTVETLFSVLSSKYKVYRALGDRDPISAIPETMINLRSKSAKMILEFSLRSPQEFDTFLSLILPTDLIITRITYKHSDNLGNIEQIFDEYRKLVESLQKDGSTILNWDDHYTRKLAPFCQNQTIFYGTDPKHCHIWAGNIKVSKNFTYFELNYGVERVNIEFKPVGRHSTLSALAAAAFGVRLGMSLFSIKKGLENVEPIKHKLEVLEGINGSLVLDDTESSSPASLEEALNVLNELPARRRIAVIGEMKELGAFSKSLHSEVARKIFKDRTIDFLLLSGRDAKIIADELSDLGFQGKVELGLSHSQIVAHILTHLETGDSVLVNGDRSMKLDEVVERITKQK